MYNLLTPWPRQANGIADYAWEIARHTSHPLKVITRSVNPKPCGEHVGIESDAYGSSLESLSRYPNVYHFGNNPDHVFLIPLFLNFPGVAVIHDVSLHYLVEQTDLIVPGFFDTQVEAQSPKLAHSLRALWQMPEMKRSLDFQEFKLLHWLREATCIVVHSHFAARTVAPFLENTKIHVVPHFAYRYKNYEVKQVRKVARAQWGIDDDCFVISTVGFVTRNKQYDAIMRACVQLPQAVRRKLVFLIGGQVRPHEYDLLNEVQRLGCREIVKITGFLSEAQIQSVLDASDLVMSLRYPSYGESSGVVARAFGLGCAVVVTDGGSYAELPDDICMKIPGKVDPSEEIANLIGTLLEDRREIDRVRSAARRYADSALDPEEIASCYSDIAHA